jgi:hypothetical protein
MADRLGQPLKVSRRRALRVAGGTSVGLFMTGSTPADWAIRSAGAQEPLAFPGDQGLDARDFGARFDGTSDDSEALQRAINAAHEQRRPLSLPGGTAILGQSLSLVGRDVSIIGQGMTATVLRAGRALPTLVDVQETADRIVSPFALMRLTLDGARITERNLAVRFRHHSWLFDVYSVNADAGFWERDCWLSRRSNCRAGDSRVGWHLVGANHSSLFEACTITACHEAHLLVESQGTAPDGNMALVFHNCDVEHGAGHGIDVGAGANIVFEGCYLGENIGGDALRNQGFVLVRGGTFFFGGGAGVGIRPLAGMATLEHVTINAQGGGIASLVNLAAAEAAGPHGQVSITGANANLPVGGDPVLQGDPLARVAMPVFAPRLGRDWQGWGQNATIREQRSPEGLPDGREVICSGVSGTGAQFGLRASLSPTRWREALPVYLACVYRSSAPFELRLRAAGQDAGHSMIVVPASPTRATYVNVSIMAPADPFSIIEAVMPATPGARLGLQEIALADGTAIRTPAGNLKTLGLAQ